MSVGTVPSTRPFEGSGKRSMKPCKAWVNPVTWKCSYGARFSIDSRSWTAVGVSAWAFLTNSARNRRGSWGVARAWSQRLDFCRSVPQVITARVAAMRANTPRLGSTAMLSKGATHSDILPCQTSRPRKKMASSLSACRSISVLASAARSGCAMRAMAELSLAEPSSAPREIRSRTSVRILLRSRNGSRAGSPPRKAISGCVAMTRLRISRSSRISQGRTTLRRGETNFTPYCSRKNKLSTAWRECPFCSKSLNHSAARSSRTSRWRNLTAP